MSSLYQMTSQLLMSHAGEDAGSRTDFTRLSRQIVDMIVNEIREHGFPSLDQVAAHDEPGGNRNKAA